MKLTTEQITELQSLISQELGGKHISKATTIQAWAETCKTLDEVKNCAKGHIAYWQERNAKTKPTDS